MKPYVICLLFVLVAAGAFAQTPSAADSSGANPDSLAAPDTTAAPPPVAAPATPPPPPPPPPAATAPAVQTQSTPPPSDIRTTETYAKDNKPSRFYYGATLGFSFWGDIRRFSIQPLLGYKLTRRLSIGGKVGYEYLKDTSGPIDHDYNNYGAAVFTRLRLTPRFYGHAEYQAISYDFDGGREIVPFLYVGGGIVQGKGRVSLYAEVLVDVLQDSNSPYNDWEPQISVGAAVGF